MRVCARVYKIKWGSEVRVRNAKVKSPSNYFHSIRGVCFSFSAVECTVRQKGKKCKRKRIEELSDAFSLCLSLSYLSFPLAAGQKPSPGRTSRSADSARYPQTPAHDFCKSTGMTLVKTEKKKNMLHTSSSTTLSH